MPSEKSLIQKIEADLEQLAQMVGRARWLHIRYLKQVEDDYQLQLAQAEQDRDHALQAANARHAQFVSQMTSQHLQKIAELEAWQQTALDQTQTQSDQTTADSAHRHEQQIQLADNNRLIATTDASTNFEMTLDNVEETHRRTTTEINAAYQESMDQQMLAYDRGLSELATHSRSISQAGGISLMGFDAQAWQQFNPSTPDTYHVPQLTRVGVLKVSGAWETISLPAGVPFIAHAGLVVETSGQAEVSAIHMAQSLGLRVLAAISPGRVRFTFIDPMGLGHNAAPFMHLADFDETLVNSRAWTEPHHIEQRLADLTEHMENVIQKYLRNQYATIEDYNAHAGEVAEPYRVLIVFDFPANFSEAAARRLVSIAQNGPRCGVYTVVLVDTAKPMPHGFTLADLEQVSTVIAWDGQRFVWQDPDFKDCLLELDAPPDADLVNRIVTCVGQAAKDAGKVEVPFARFAPPPSSWWSADSRNGLLAPLGPSGAHKTQRLDLGQGTAQHVLVAGKTGAGKSSLLHTLITSLSLAYDPEQVELYLIDFKKGVEFKTYAAHELPHARVIAIESEREFGLSVLQGLDVELRRRGDCFRTASVDNLADYRRKNDSLMPRILLLVDEFQEFFTIDDPIASQASQILDRLVRQGRAFGVHVLLGSQTLAGAYSLARSTIDQMAVRIALQCSEADSRLILADDNPAARLLSRPGEAIYNAANGLVEGNNRFQIAWLSDEQRDDYLERIANLAHARAYHPVHSQIVFEGNAPADAARNQVLHELLSAPRPELLTPRTTRAWLGDPIAIKPPVVATFRRQSGSNLLMVGQNDEAALSMMMVSLISLAMQLPLGDKPNLFVLDFGAHADTFDHSSEIFPGMVQIGRRRQLSDIISELSQQVQRRLDSEEAGFPPRHLFIYGLQRARDLRQEDSFVLPAFDAEPAGPSLSQQFASILREGPDVGVHTIVWCDTATNLNRSLDRRLLREFSMRIVFQMSAEDSANLIDTPAASKLGQHRAFFYDEEEGQLDKFRPYGLPSAEWLAWVQGQFQHENSHGEP